MDSRGWEVSSSEGAPSLAYIDPGFGGAVYAFYTSLLFVTSGFFAGNSAKFGMKPGGVRASGKQGVCTSMVTA